MLWFVSVYSIQPFGCLAAAMLGEVVGESRGIEPAATQPEPPTKRFGRLEEVVRDRESDFHTVVLPWYEMAGKLSGRSGY